MYSPDEPDSLHSDVILIGGGIVGISTAYHLLSSNPGISVTVIEKESVLACHQTGHNSGVVHAGVYYEPGSLKADMCKRGNKATLSFCRKHNIDYEQCGKLLVATDANEEKRMRALYHRCQKNGITAEIVERNQLQRLEPHIQGRSAILVRDTAIVDYKQITRKIAELFLGLGGKILLNHEVTDLVEAESYAELIIKNGGKNTVYRTRYIVACAGLQADRLAKMMDLETDFSIIPYRGEYYRLPSSHSDCIQHLIYPIPDPKLPFLGVHLTRMIDGQITAGPNAVQGWKREGYGKYNFNLRDTLDMILFPGFWCASKKHFGAGIAEIRDSLWKRGYLNKIKKYYPNIRLSDLKPYPAGIRAQAVLADGTLVHDFLFTKSKRSLHVCNAPSPAATSAFPIGEFICNEIKQSIPT